jgi:hypothetical protein
MSPAKKKKEEKKGGKDGDEPVEIETRIIHDRVSAKKPLGRFVRHDPRSWNYPSPRAHKIVSVLHKRHGRPFQQGTKLGSCTGNAVAGMLMTEPFFRKDRRLTERDAVHIYSRATHLDPIKGIYPPTDTGSSGLAAMKAAHELGYIQSYGHAFGLEHALKTLVLTPVVTGSWWYDGFDHPDMFGRVKKKGPIVGGHEFLVVGIDVEEKMVRACNSWGPDWGDGGYFTFSWAAWELLLDQDGDVTTATAGRPKPKHGWTR